MRDPLPLDATPDERRDRYAEVMTGIRALLEDEPDWVAAMATTVCELHGAFAWYDWTGFYRVTAPGEMTIGPYQGGHGCLRIAFERGVCGAAARTKTTQLVPDVHAFPDHIACSSTTLSELVVPVLAPDGTVVAVLDIDSDTAAAFDATDAAALEELCAWLGDTYASAAASVR